LPDAGIFAAFYKAAESQQMESVRSRAMFLGVLQGVGIHRQQMDGPVRDIGILFDANRLKDSVATPESDWQERTTQPTISRVHVARTFAYPET
jgi:hypothetical protein